MVGYGPEDNHFVIEVTYNYNVGSYQLGNDFEGIHIHSRSVFQKAKESKHPFTAVADGSIKIADPDGHVFYIHDADSENTDPLTKLSIYASDLAKSINFWANTLGMMESEQSCDHVVLAFPGKDQCKLEIKSRGEKVTRTTASGRIAFAVHSSELPKTEAGVRKHGGTVLTPLMSLDTPGKATVQVIILADPDGHEVCFVGDEAFRELSKVDPQADEQIQKAIAADKSADWFAGKGGKQSS